MALLRVTISGEDLDAAFREVVEIMVRYGPEVQPHLKAQVERELSRIAKVLSECVDFERLDDEHS